MANSQVPIEDKTQILYRTLEAARPLLFVGLLILGLLGLVVNQQFQSQKISVSWFAISLAGLLIHFQFIMNSESTQRVRLFLSCISSLLLCILLYQMQSAQSLYLILLLVNILIAGLQDGSQQSTQVALFSSFCFSGVIILSPNFSHFQDLLALGLFNFSALMTAALSGLYFERLDVTLKAYDTAKDLFQDLSSRYQILIEELPLGILVYDEKGVVIETNSLFEKEYQHSIDKDELFITATKKEFNIFSLRAQKGSQFLEFTMRSRKLNVSNRQYWLVLVEDVTETRKLEEDLKQKEKMAAIGTLAAGIAHEIRNPLAGMSGSVELLSVKPNTEEDQKLFKIILREIDRLNRLIGEFLDYSRPNQPLTEKINLNQVVQLVLSSLESSKDRPQNLKINLELKDNFQILGSSDKLKQALLNIVINSLQAMTGVSSPELFVTLEKGTQENTVCLRIRDTGCGMSESTRVKMFEPFHTTKPKGTGLGLAITHKILESHQAQISVSSEVGQGTEFQLIFPCA